MKFTIGAWKYRVHVVDEPLLDDEGEPCSGLCVWKDRKIFIAGDVPVLSRLEVLVHELWHAWEHHAGGPGADNESRANTAASFGAMLYRELFMQGGEGALMRLTSAGIVDTARPIPEQPAATFNCECPACGTRISHQNVVDGLPFTSGGIVRLSRATYCPHCETCFTWHEVATRTGGPSGCVVGNPEFLRAEAAADLKRLHGHRFGLLQLTSCDGVSGDSPASPHSSEESQVPPAAWEA